MPIFENRAVLRMDNPITKDEEEKAVCWICPKCIADANYDRNGTTISNQKRTCCFCGKRTADCSTLWLFLRGPNYFWNGVAALPRHLNWHGPPHKEAATPEQDALKRLLATIGRNGT